MDAEQQPTSDTVAPEGPSEAAPVETAAAPERATTAEPDIWARIAELDPDELVQRNPRLGGKVGELADRLERKREAEREAKRQAEERTRLRREDPVRYAELDEQQEQQRTQAERVVADAMTAVEKVLAKVPQEMQARVRTGRTYTGGFWEGMSAYLEDVAEVLADHRATGKTQEAVAKLQAEFAKREKEIREAARKEALAETNGQEPAPDVGGGAPARGFKMPSLAELDAMSPADYAKQRNNILSRLPS